MIATEMLQKISESLGATANVKSVFGEPIQLEGKTVVPVAKVAYGFGAGGGRAPFRRGSGDKEGSGEHPEGGGGGGGVKAYPVGALEITPGATRFIPYTDTGMLAGAVAAGALLGVLLMWRRR